MNVLRLAAFVLIAGLVNVIGLAQSTPQTPARDRAVGQAGTARIRGRVTTAENGAPLRRADVRIAATSGQTIENALVATDEQGHFEFRALTPGSYTFTASKTGYMAMVYGQRRPRELPRPVAVSEGQSVDGIDISLPKGATIVARITDAFGEPMSGVSVRALEHRFVSPELQYRFPMGERRLTSAGAALDVTAGFGATNDLGIQRIHGLPPGDYYVAVQSAGIDRAATGGRSYSPTYHPGTVRFAEAQRVTLGVGQEASVSFSLVAQRTYKISGVALSSSGTPFRGPTVVLFDTSVSANGSAAGVAVAQPDGSFSIAGVFPGEYAINVTGGMVDPNGTPEFVSMPVSVVDRDLSGLTVTTNKGSTIRGQIVFDTGTPPPGLRPGTVQLTLGFPAGSCVAGRTVWNPDWTFESRGVNCAATRLSLAQGTAPGWFLKGIMLDGKDVTDAPFNFSDGRDVRDLQVVLTQKRTDVAGGAVDQQSAPVNDYVAVFFPEDRSLWTGVSRYIATARPDMKGQFRMLGLPPGRYLATALDYLPSGEERDPELLKRLADRATTLTLGEGEAKSVGLTVVSY